MTLPQGWVETTLGEIGAWGSGGTPKAGHSAFYSGEIPWIRSGDLPDGPIVSHEATISEAGLINSSAKWVDKNAVLVAMYGATIGKVGYTTYPVTTNQAVAFVQPAENIDTAYLFYNLRSRRAELIKMGQGGAQPNISQEILKCQPVPIPPKNEQGRIVAKLETIGTCLARAREQINRVPIFTERLRVNILREVFDRREAEMPAGWKLKRVDEIGQVQLGRQRSPKDHHGPNMRPYVRSANITWKGWDFSDIKEMNFSPAESDIFSLEIGDVLLNEGSGSAKEVGKPAIWYGGVDGACFQNTLLRVRPREYLPELLRYAFLYLARSGQFIANTKGINIIHIGKAGLAKTMLPVPPRDEQQAILARFEATFARADRLEAEAARARALLDRLEAAILAKAFRGELVPQDPDDEPASVLLDRIRAERAATPRPKRGRARKAVA